MTHTLRDSRARAAMALRILGALGLGAASFPMAACGGNVVVDASGAGGAGGGGGGGGSTIVPVDCVTPASGELVEVCSGSQYPSCAPVSEVESDLFASQVNGGNDCAGSGTCCDLLAGNGCGPYAGSTGACCYQIDVEFYGCEGRPLMVDGEPRVAGTVARRDWLEDMPLPETAGLDEGTRRVLSERFRETAQYEHASVASFARFTLELLGLGAPSDLVLAAQHAALDEVRHARVTFALASAYAGAPVGPSALDLGGASVMVRSPAEIAASVAFEGCINETISALLCAAERDRATDHAVKVALDGIAVDESAHAELAWRSLGWMLSVGEEAVLDAVRGILSDPPPFSAREVSLEGASREALTAHGWLSAAEKRAIAEAAMHDVVLPCARALLRRPAPRRAERALAA